MSQQEDTPFLHSPHPWRGVRPWQRHGLVLLVAGLSYIVVGINYIRARPDDGRDAALWLALKWVPLTVWGCVFVLVGILAIISSRWPPVSSTWGYTSLTGLSAGWATFYAFGMLSREASASTTLNGIILWGLLAFLWWAISGLVNPSSPPVVDKEPDNDNGD